jgi:hypothetical protein
VYLKYFFLIFKNNLLVKSYLVADYLNKLLIMLTVIFFFALFFSIWSIILFIWSLVKGATNKETINFFWIIVLCFTSAILWTLFYHLNH